MKGWLYDLSPALHLDMAAHLDALRARLAGDGRYLESIVQQHLLDNPHCSILTFVPDPDMVARTAGETAAELAACKAAMSTDELAALADENQRLEALQSAPNTPEELATLPRLKITDVPIDPLELPTQRLQADAATLLATDIFANGVNYLEVAVDLRQLDEELVPYLPLYAEALRKMGAAGDDYARTAEREAALTGGMSLAFSFHGRVDEPRFVQPALVVGYNALDRNLDATLALLQDRLLECDLDDEDRLHDIIIQRRARLRTALISRSSSYAQMFAGSHASRNGALRERVSGLHAMRDFELWGEGDGELLAGLRERLARIRDFVRRRTGITASLVGEPSQATQVAEWLQEFAQPGDGLAVTLDAGNHAPGYGRRDAFAIPSAVAAVAVNLDLNHMAPDDRAVVFMLAANLSYGYLWDEVRVKGSAYGVHAQYDLGQGSLMFSSSQDPNVRDTIDAFIGTGNHIATAMDLSEQAVEQALIGAFRKLDNPLRGAEACHVALTRYLTGLTPDFRRDFRARLRGVTADDIRRVNATILAPSFAQANICVLANQQKLNEANAELSDAPLMVRQVGDVGER
jgi:Zn-dependent M16 (insulinase) family peptidase